MPDDLSAAEGVGLSAAERESLAREWAARVCPEYHGHGQSHTPELNQGCALALDLCREVIAGPLVEHVRAAERRGELRALRECTDLYCDADKALIRGWADSLVDRIARETP